MLIKQSVKHYLCMSRVSCTLLFGISALLLGMLGKL
jgi:hypothetical protein